MTQSRKFLDSGKLPLDQFGCQMSANMFDMRRAIALQTGTMFKEPPKPKRTNMWGKVKSDVVRDEHDLGNTLGIPPVVRNVYSKVSARSSHRLRQL